MNDGCRIERRSAQRFAMHDPVCIKSPNRTAPDWGLIQDVSTHGMLFYTDALFNKDEALELTFAMPEEVTLGERMRVRAFGKVLRVVSPTIGSKSGIVVHMERYEFLPETDSAVSHPEISSGMDSAHAEELSLSANVFQAHSDNLSERLR